MKRESVFRRKVNEDLKKLKNGFWMSIQQRALRGDPDKIGVLRGEFIALELKAHLSAEVRELQRYKLERIREAGGFAEIVSPENWEEIFVILESKNRDKI